MGGGLCYGGPRAPQGRWTCVCLCEIECVAMRSAAVASTRFSVKNGRGWTGCLSNTLFPFILDKRTTRDTKMTTRTECRPPRTWGRLQLGWICTLILKPVYIQKPWLPWLKLLWKTVLRNVIFPNNDQFLPSIGFGFAQSFPPWLLTWNLLCKTEILYHC